ncbi:MAG: L,D-transpeptidase family protein [Firmicutes bacterium]|nr:L,D-transpeptidase family protein [Bacillota bacterium]
MAKLEPRSPGRRVFAIAFFGLLMLFMLCGRWVELAAATDTTESPLDIYQARRYTEIDEPMDRTGRLGDAGCESDRLLYLADPPMAGEDVRELQYGLQRLGLYGDPISGKFDRLLMQAVRSFQRQHSLKADGVVGECTWQALSDDFPIPVIEGVESIPEGEREITIDVARRQLTVYIDGKEFRRFAVAVGLSKTPSPIGEFRIVHKSMNWGGGFGTRWLGLNVPWGIYGIHGTNKPWSIGTMASGGCIRMFNSHVEYLYRIIPEGTLVRMVGRDSDPVTRHLKPGSYGQDVITLQLALKERGCDCGLADGRYGEQTQEAVKEVQKDYGMLPDGLGWPDVYLVLGVK